AMLTKAFAFSIIKRTKFIQLPLHRAATHVAAEKAITSACEPDLEWRRIVAGKWHEVDCPSKCQRPVFKCIGAPKDFGMTDCRNVHILENCLAIPLVEVQAVHQKHHTEWLIFGCDSGPPNGNLGNFDAVFRLKENAWCALQQILEV